MNKIIMRVCLARKRMCLPRTMVHLFGNPSHLSFWYDEVHYNLIVSPATKDDLDAYEIPQYYWRSEKHSCEVARIAFLLALQHRFRWEKDSRYIFEGFIKTPAEHPVAVFELTNGTRLK